MTSAALFNSGREGFLAGEIDWDTATIKVALCRGYTFNAANKFVADLAGVTQVATATLTGKAVTGGIAGANDIVFSAVAVGPACTQLIIYQASAVGGGADVAPSAQRLIAYIDNATGLPITPNGADIDVSWDTGANKIFSL